MAIGDAAGAKGLKVYSASDLVNLGYQQINQRGDELAALMTRTDGLEKQVKGTPKFIVKRSSNGQNIAAGPWTQLTSGAWGKPKKTQGGFDWSGGNLTVPRAGNYWIVAHVQYRDNDYGSCGVLVTRNSTSTVTSSTVAADEWWAETQTTGLSMNPSVRTVEMVSLNAGDVLRFFTFQRSRNNETVRLGSLEFDLTWTVIWDSEL